VRAGALTALLGVTLSGCSPAPEPNPMLLPGFAAAVERLQRIDVAQGDAALVFERRDGRWWVADAEWPVAVDWLSPLLIGLLDARCDEPRTADPAQYPRIGVGWPPQPAAEGAETHREAGAAAFSGQSGRIALDWGAGTQALVIGHARPRGGTYVRIDGTAASCLTRADLRVPVRASQWFEPKLLDAAPDDVAAVTVRDPGQPPLPLVRGENGWRLEGQGVALSPVAAALGTAAANLRQIDVARASQSFEAQRTLDLTLADGSSVSVALRREGAATFAEVQAGADSARYRQRRFLLPEDVAAPLWGSLAGLGASAGATD